MNWDVFVTPSGTRRSLHPVAAELRGEQIMGLGNYRYLAGIGAPITQEVLAKANEINTLLKTVGFSEQAAYWATVQCYTETGGFTSPVFLQNNNASGIKWIPASNTQNATRGRKAPGKECNAKTGAGCYYANFPDLKAWAIDYKRILSRGPAANRPINATSLDDFAKRLKINGYYTDTVQNYSRNLKSVAQRLRILKQLDTDTKQQIVTPPGSRWQDFKPPSWAVWAFGGVLALMLINNSRD